jgi:hypothetical protein
VYCWVSLFVSLFVWWNVGGTLVDCFVPFTGAVWSDWLTYFSLLIGVNVVLLLIGVMVYCFFTGEIGVILF